MFKILKLNISIDIYRDYEGNVNTRLKWADCDTSVSSAPKTEAPSLIFIVAKMCN